jgi:hypothetical protein
LWWIRGFIPQLEIILRLLGSSDHEPEVGREEVTGKFGIVLVIPVPDRREFGLALLKQNLEIFIDDLLRQCTDLIVVLICASRDVQGNVIARRRRHGCV